MAEVVAALDDDASGGLTLFVGRVRDHDSGKGVVGLDYSAHPTALDRLRDVCDRVAAEYDVLGARRRAPHRAASTIGDIAVVVATAAAHRGDAFDASRALIDTLKAEVPIWKHQRVRRRHRGVGRHAVRRACRGPGARGAYPRPVEILLLAGAARRRDRAWRCCG